MRWPLGSAGEGQLLAPERGIGREGKDGGKRTQGETPFVEGEIDDGDQQRGGEDGWHKAGALAGGEAADAEAEEADDKREVLEEGEDFDFSAEPADEDDFQIERSGADEEKPPG